MNRNSLSLNKFDRFIRIPFIYFNLFNCVNRQRKFINSNLIIDLDKFRLENDGSLDEQDFNKITNYYGLGVPAILGEAFCILRGRRMTLKERLASTYQGAMTGLFDDFFDKKDTSLAQIIEIIDNPYKHEGGNANERMFLHFYKKMLENTDLQDRIRKSLFDVYDAQVRSRMQASIPLPEKEIRDITFQKGGVSLLFYRAAFPHYMDKEEKEMLYLMGGLMQLGNDIFDVYKDIQAGIKTLITNTKNINTIRLLFKDSMVQWNSLTNQLNYPKQNRERFKRFFTLGMSRCYVCLDQLEILEKRSDNVFTPSLYSRSELICDMEKIGNIIKSTKYYLSS
jgi:hypothetical protein